MAKMLGKTARQWLIEFAAGHNRRYGCGAHMALEAIYDQSLAAKPNTLIKAAGAHYHGCSQVELTRLINAVDRASNGKVTR